ncbi:hypothetical protein [Kaarinaea lacus]
MQNLSVKQFLFLIVLSMALFLLIQSATILSNTRSMESHVADLITKVNPIRKSSIN